ncbi:D-alanine--D-alanine ligase [Candidatus Poribacteria bacterium]|nr:MAG: D-alanine--D-alanine ligase [Candidatus Poribacteria bacterium]
MSKHNVALIFGGCTPEHEVSIVTAHQVCLALQENHHVVPIYVTKTGEWLTGDALRDLSTFTNGTLPHASDFDKVAVEFHPEPKFVINAKHWLGQKVQKRTVLPIDVVFPAIHGMHGEDGTLQGLLELMNLPYVGAGVVGSAVGMDKIMMKAVLNENELPILPYLWWTQHAWETQCDEIIKDVETTLTYPLFVKPAMGGSSIGVSHVKNQTELVSAVGVAGHYSRRILVEKAVEDPVEINCAVMGTEEPTPSVCEQPITQANFLSFDDKYIHQEEESSGMAGADRKIPAPISEKLSLHIQGLATRTFQVLDCAGVARIDFLVDVDQNVYVNEINTIPGSYSYYLWVHQGIEFPKLVSELIDLALTVHAEKNSLTYTYTTNLLSQADASLAKLKSDGKLGTTA